MTINNTQNDNKNIFIIKYYIIFHCINNKVSIKHNLHFWQDTTELKVKGLVQTEMFGPAGVFWSVTQTFNH